MPSPNDAYGGTLITEEEVERALDWMVSNAAKAAEARAAREHLSEYRKVLKAQLMRERSELPLAAQEREAYGDPRYVEHLDALRTAIEQDERYRWLATAAEVRVSAWQTQSKVNKV